MLPTAVACFVRDSRSSQDGHAFDYDDFDFDSDSDFGSDSSFNLILI